MKVMPTILIESQCILFFNNPVFSPCLKSALKHTTLTGTLSITNMRTIHSFGSLQSK